MVLKQPLQIFNGFWGDHHHWMFFGGLTIAIDGFSMFFLFFYHRFQWVRWFRTIGQTMRWFRWIVVVYCWPRNQTPFQNSDIDRFGRWRIPPYSWINIDNVEINTSLILLIWWHYVMDGLFVTLTTGDTTVKNTGSEALQSEGKSSKSKTLRSFMLTLYPSKHLF